MVRVLICLSDYDHYRPSVAILLSEHYPVGSNLLRIKERPHFAELRGTKYLAYVI